MSFNTDAPIKIIGGRNVITDNSEMFKDFGKKCLIITGGRSALLNGALRDVTNALEKCKIKYDIFDKISENPKTTDSKKAGDMANGFGADFIVGIGGGSPLDASKAAAVYAVYPNINADDIYTLEIKKQPLPVILVGTTAGTGSEVSGVAVLTAESGKKKSVGGKKYYAKLAFADAKYTFSVPYGTTVSTALDVLAHAVEGYLSSRANDASKEYAKIALPMIWKELKEINEKRELPNEEARERLYDASLYAGEVLNICGTCFPHAVGYFLTELFGVPHGKACAVFLPAFVKRGMEYEPEKAKELLEILDTTFDEFEALVLTLADLKIFLNVEQIDNYLSNWQSVKNFDNSPGGYNPYLAKALLIKQFVTAD